MRQVECAQRLDPPVQSVVDRRRVHPPAPVAVGLARHPFARIKIQIPIQPVRRHRLDGGSTAEQQRCELIDPINPAGQSDGVPANHQIIIAPDFGVIFDRGTALDVDIALGYGIALELNIVAHVDGGGLLGRLLRRFDRHFRCRPIFDHPRQRLTADRRRRRHSGRGDQTIDARSVEHRIVAEIRQKRFDKPSGHLVDLGLDGGPIVGVAVGPATGRCTGTVASPIQPLPRGGGKGIVERADRRADR